MECATLDYLTEGQVTLLKSKYISKSKFEVGGFIFDGWEGEWLITKNGVSIDVFTFRNMTKKEFEKNYSRYF